MNKKMQHAEYLTNIVMPSQLLFAGKVA